MKIIYSVFSIFFSTNLWKNFYIPQIKFEDIKVGNNQTLNDYHPSIKYSKGNMSKYTNELKLGITNESSSASRVMNMKTKFIILVLGIVLTSTFSWSKSL